MHPKLICMMKGAWPFEFDEPNIIIEETGAESHSTSNSSNRKELKRTKCENTDGSQMVALGNGSTEIHRAIYNKINWTCYSKATRCLLKAVFPRRVLATHCLTGKPSPAFREKQTKLSLDYRKVIDIINEVRDKFRVPENCVRSVITKTCADECKMYRKSAKKKNVPPTKKDSDNKPNTELTDLQF